MPPQAVQISGLSHWYGPRRALENVSLEIASGEVYALLGPNGGGKTTLFRVLSTLVAPQDGTVRVLGRDVVEQTRAVRGLLGVVFQAPSLDRKLTVAENMRQQAALYGIAGTVARRRCDRLLAQLNLSDRALDRVESLSGGLRRRVELAKCLIHEPRLLAMDEPSTGLDPGARSDLWRCLGQLQDEREVTIVLTTHLLEEAEKADRLGILHQGRMVAEGKPEALRAEIGGDAIVLQTKRPDELATRIQQRFGAAVQVIDGRVRLEQPEGCQWAARLAEAFPGLIEAVSVGRPTLEDVFIDRTGHRFWEESDHAGGR